MVGGLLRYGYNRFVEIFLMILDVSKIEFQ
jgi:hypothetical protein